MPTTDHLAQLVEQRIDAARVPGAAVAIVRDREVIYARGFGVTSVEDGGVPVSPQTLFRVGSLTKPLTATAILRLVDRGAVDLDQPVTTYLPWFTLREPGAAELVTLRLLLSHRAGLPSRYELSGSREATALEAWFRYALPTTVLLARPGLLWAYSNIGFDLAGLVAEVVTGMPYADLMHDLVFAPLAMERTTVDPLVAMTYPLAQAHSLGHDGQLHVEHRGVENTQMAPSSMAFSSVLDLANFALLHLNTGAFRGQRLLAAASVDEMHRRQADLYLGPERGYGLGFFLDTTTGRRYVWHSGGISTYWARLFLLPDERVAVIAAFSGATQPVDIDGLRDGIFDHVLGAPMAPSPPTTIPPDRATWPRLTGTYLGHFTGWVEISVDADRLVLQWKGDELTLEPLSDDLYRARHPTRDEEIRVGFIPGGDGPCQYLLVNAAVCRRSEQPPTWHPTTATLDRFAGTYTERGIGTIVVRRKDGHLVMQPSWIRDELTYEPVEADRFVGRDNVIEFVEGADGSVVALKLGGEWTMPKTAAMPAPAGSTRAQPR